MHFHVLIKVSSLCESLATVLSLANEGSLSRVDTNVISEVVRLLKISCAGINSTYTIWMLALPNLQSSPRFWVDEADYSIHRAIRIFLFLRLVGVLHLSFPHVILAGNNCFRFNILEYF